METITTTKMARSTITEPDQLPKVMNITMAPNTIMARTEPNTNMALAPIQQDTVLTNMGTKKPTIIITKMARSMITEPDQLPKVMNITMAPNTIMARTEPNTNTALAHIQQDTVLTNMGTKEPTIIITKMARSTITELDQLPKVMNITMAPNTIMARTEPNTNTVLALIQLVMEPTREPLTQEPPTTLMVQQVPTTIIITPRSMNMEPDHTQKVTSMPTAKNITITIMEPSMNMELDLTLEDALIMQKEPLTIMDKMELTTVMAKNMTRPMTMVTQPPLTITTTMELSMTTELVHTPKVTNITMARSIIIAKMEPDTNTEPGHIHKAASTVMMARPIITEPMASNTIMVMNIESINSRTMTSRINLTRI